MPAIVFMFAGMARSYTTYAIFRGQARSYR
jgi:hypothetical protein